MIDTLDDRESRRRILTEGEMEGLRDRRRYAFVVLAHKQTADGAWINSRVPQTRGLSDTIQEISACYALTHRGLLRLGLSGDMI
jgi:hypothetical protein